MPAPTSHLASSPAVATPRWRLKHWEPRMSRFYHHEITNGEFQTPCSAISPLCTFVPFVVYAFPGFSEIGQPFKKWPPVGNIGNNAVIMRVSRELLSGNGAGTEREQAGTPGTLTPLNSTEEPSREYVQKTGIASGTSGTTQYLCGRNGNF